MEVISAEGADAAERAAAIVLAGGIVAYPTDTTYALGVNAGDPKAVDALIGLKGRDPSRPISVAVADLAGVTRIAKVSPLARRVILAFLPGPLTIVLPARSRFESPVVSGGRVGIRIPKHDFCSKFLAKANVPVTATSANRSGSPPAVNPSEILPLGGEPNGALAMLIDAGPTALGAPSTVIAIEDDRIRLIREGAVSFEALSQIL